MPEDSADNQRAVEGRQGTSPPVVSASPASSREAERVTADGFAHRLTLTPCTAAGPTGNGPGEFPGRPCADSGREIRRIPARTQMWV